jgi:hypothetical protein
MFGRITGFNMLDYACQRAIQALKVPRRAVLVTSGPAGVQVSEGPCAAIDLKLYLLVPQTSDHLFNLESDPSVTLLAANWVLKGTARIIPPNVLNLEPGLFQVSEEQGCILVQVDPCQVQIRREQGWGNLETIDDISSR